MALRAFLLLAACVANASALLVSQSLSRPVASVRATSPQMKDIIRVQIDIEQGEPLEKALRRFRKASNMVGHLRILRTKKMFESAHDKKIRKTKEGSMRNARARRSARQAANKF